MKAKNLISLFLLELILIAALITRIINLSYNPYGFFCDEASIGVNAFSILTTGKDEVGERFPIFFKAFGEYKSPIQIYSTIPAIAIFGLNEFAVRITSVVWGILSILSVFLLVKELLHKDKEKIIGALFASFFLAFSPWHFHIGRIGFEQMPFVFFTTMGTYFFIKKSDGKNFIVSSVLFALAIYTYFPARIFIPAFVFSLFIIYSKTVLNYKKYIMAAIIIGIIICIPYLNHTLSPQGMERWKKVNIFNNPPENSTALNHIVENYESHFSYDFLFTKGDIDSKGQFITRHSVRGFGQLLIIQLPLILIGILYLLKSRNFTSFLTIASWLFLYPLGSMFTTDTSAQATRSIIGVVPFQILSAISITYIYKLFKQQWLKIIFLVIMALTIIINFGIYFANFNQKYNDYASDFWGWQAGARDIVLYFKTVENQFDQLIMAPEFNEPQIFFKLYDPDDCKKCIVGLPTTNFDPTKKQLFAVTPQFILEHPEYKFRINKTILYPIKSVAFQIGEIIQ